MMVATPAMGLLIQLLPTKIGWRHLAELALIGVIIIEVIRSVTAIQILSRGFLPFCDGVLITVGDW